MNERSPTFLIQDGELIISGSTGQVLWQGMPLGEPVSDVQTIPGSDRAIVLLDYMRRPTGPFENLLCVAGDGRVVWVAPLPSSSMSDAYVSFDLGTGSVEANSWSGYHVRIDPTSGTLDSQEFVK